MALIALAVAPAVLRSDEPVEAFLTALRDRGYYELAVAYLDGLASRSFLSPGIQQTLKYEQGTTLVQAALRSTNARGKHSTWTALRRNLSSSGPSRRSTHCCFRPTRNWERF